MRIEDGTSSMSSRFQLFEKLGSGSAGVVYRAWDRLLAKNVALKFLSPLWSENDSIRERFAREARASSLLHHPNIARVYSYEESKTGQPFLVMEYCPGETLRQRLDRAPLHWTEAAEIARQLARALAEAHALGIVHRDVKPENLILTESGVVKLIDLGLAKILEDASFSTEASTTVGTLAYMSPEQTRGAAASIQTDLWSLGVVLFEMLSGEHPFRRSHPQATIYAVRHDPLPALPTLRASSGDLPPRRLSALVVECLDRNPAHRPPSVTRVLRELTALLQRHPLKRALPKLRPKFAPWLSTSFTERTRAEALVQDMGDGLPTLQRVQVA